MDNAFINDLCSMLQTTYSDIEKLKELCYKKYVIKEKNISSTYYQRISKEYYNNSYHLNNPEKKSEEDLRNKWTLNAIIEQQESLDVWLDYLINDLTIPSWLKMWIFEGALSIGYLNEENSSYVVRRVTSVNPFVELDVEILKECVNTVLNHFRDISNLNVAKKSIQSISFAKIYVATLIEKQASNKIDIDGIWVLYSSEDDKEIEYKEKNGIEPEYIKLYKSLQGYNTGWSVEDSLDKAKKQIETGDYHIFYIKDRSGEYVIPKIACRIDNRGSIDIRGTSYGANIDAGYEDVIEQKINETGGKLRYSGALKDMRMLRKIYNKKEEELTLGQLKFLYEIGCSITGFGYFKDKRIDEIRKRINSVNCLNKIFVNVSNIEQTLDLYYLDNADGLVFPNRFVGNIYMNNVKYIDNISLPIILEGTLAMRSLERAKSLVLPRIVKGAVNLSGLKSAKNIIFSDYIGSSLLLDSLEEDDGLILSKVIGDSLILKSLKAGNYLYLPLKIGQNLDLSSMETADYLVMPHSVKGNVYFDTLNDIGTIIFSERIDGLIYYKGESYSLNEFLNLLSSKKK